MYHILYSHPGAVARSPYEVTMCPQSFPTQPSYSLGTQAMQSYPIDVSSGQTMMYCVPATSEANLHQVPFSSIPSLPCSSASFTHGNQTTSAVCNSNPPAPVGMCHKMIPQSLPTLLQPHTSGPTFLTVSHLSPTTSKHTVGTFSQVEKMLTHEISTGSGDSTHALSSAATNTTSSMRASQNMPTPPPSYPTTSPLPLATRTTVSAPQQQQPETCIWMSSSVPSSTSIHAPEVIPLSNSSVGLSLNAYTMAPSPVPPRMSSYIGPVAQALSTPIPGTATLYMSALPPPPPPPPPPLPKALNGLQYHLGELYEGTVKRYNPNRGFGFLTATAHVSVRSDGSDREQYTSTPVQLGDVFVHQSSMQMAGFRTLPVGGRVRFRIGYKDGQQTFQAVDVELLPQVLPPCLEMTLSTMPTQRDATTTCEQTASCKIPSQRESQPDMSTGDCSASERDSDSQTVNYTPSDDGKVLGKDKPLIALDFRSLSDFE